MASYNITILKPEEEEPYYNALQLQAPTLAFGHQNNSSPYTDAHIATSGRTGHTFTFPHIPTIGLSNPYPSRSQLTQLEPVPHQSFSEMQGRQPAELDEAQRNHAIASSAFPHEQQPSAQVSPALYGWHLVNEFANPNTSPYFVNGSPVSQGQSPLTPITPLSTIEPSPTVSSFPSPGSQGSNEALRLAPSPAHQTPALGGVSEVSGAFGQFQPSVYNHPRGSETQLSASQTYVQSPPPPCQYSSDSTSNLVLSGTVTRRHSHSGPSRPQDQSALSPRYSPYPVHPSLPTRNSSLLADVRLIGRPEYKFEHWELPGPMVPQTVYSPQTASDRRRYVEECELLPVIYFERSDGPGLGMALVECVTQRFKSLVGSEDEVLEACGPSISVRINWSGYDSWSRQIPTRNFKVPPGPVTRQHLAKNVAKTVQKFIDDRIDLSMRPGADIRWQVGPGKIEFSDLVLLSMHHVSRGSWQANLCLNQPLEQILSRPFVSQ